MNLRQELFDSALWLTQAFFGSFLFLIMLAVFLIKFSRWGKQFWQLAADYIDPKNNLKAIILFMIIVLLSLMAVRLSVLFSNWYNTMYTALQEMNVNTFWSSIVLFTVLASIHIVLSLTNFYLSQRFIIQWRVKLNQRFIDRWTANRTYYKTQYSYNQLDNPDQRIQQDIQSFVSSTLSFSTGLISAITSIVAFTLILWKLSGSLSIFNIEIPHGMVFISFSYVLIASLFAFKIGRPLISLNFLSEKLNANYRYSLIRIKEYAESIAFYKGEKTERSILLNQFDRVIANVWQIVYRTLKFSGFNFVVSQTSVIFPFLIQAGRFFSQQISLGDLMQTANVFGQLDSALSFFRNSYDNFAAYKATLDRLTGFNSAMRSAEQLPMPTIHEHSDRLQVTDLTVKTPSHAPLIKQLNLDLASNSRLLIQGASGVGKTTLLRTFAGLWAYADGEIATPSNALFLSQKPYLPQGSLLDALYYPNPAPQKADYQHEEAVLQKVALAHLSEKLTRHEEWTQILSLGEQQRIAFARVLLNKPQIIFLDEASASMDEGLEDAMYRLLLQELPNSTVISVGHRSTLKRFHTSLLYIEQDGSWRLENA
ncbi:ABC transporter ATP-binding protein/permease [Testudinibacter sp. TR-2022]|uniref:ABC transporter ATP-binding protein/permease n=1 Tax=Testudinibacter sp. TR-2022 TaxID=2585029 RepID=UPI00111B9DE3|nr:ABC transporter ATP-binding protein/permease [Testudinibacter sp. TR-2022]TNH03953.1 ABC transporter ATP-binding protein/permease [Pasteurellaceae bacterium Phil31]TNH09566.1 ABC transporter ATP-binding protein/permease [Testudinibacter sp. TR-2022]TNH10076.1 ABC transporter ATP-binding protein/permease [Testudinibacter sp. TR-2022]TNH17266.1 ABC transporter ATP-binding protein/permease [Testudinibacter sp. TR-2022]TNH17346.1 ABC transporter ATP-binding protein/permease [Testudinibacter sp.